MQHGLKNATQVLDKKIEHSAPMIGVECFFILLAVNINKGLRVLLLLFIVLPLSAVPIP